MDCRARPPLNPFTRHSGAGAPGLPSLRDDYLHAVPQATFVALSDEPSDAVPRVVVDLVELSSRISTPSEPRLPLRRRCGSKPQTAGLIDEGQHER